MSTPRLGRSWPREKDSTTLLPVLTSRGRTLDGFKLLKIDQ